MRSLNVLFVSTYGAKCGISTYTEQLVDGCRSLNTGSSIGVLAEDEGYSTDPLVEYAWNRSSLDYQALLSEILKNKYDSYDVVHFQHEYGLFGGLEEFANCVHQLRLRGRKVYVTMHTVHPAIRRHPGEWVSSTGDARVLRFLAKNSYIIVHSYGCKDALESVGCDSDKILVIQHGTQASKQIHSTEYCRKLLGIPLGCTVSLTFGFIGEGKKQIEIARVVDFMSRAHFNNTLKCVIAGTPHEHDRSGKEYADKLTKELESLPNVILIDRFVDDVQIPILYGATDFSILGSARTPFGISGRSHLELAYGRLIIAEAVRLHDDLTGRSLMYSTPIELQWAVYQAVAFSGCANIQYLIDSAINFAEETRWSKIAGKHMAAYAMRHGPGVSLRRAREKIARLIGRRD